MKIAYYFSSDFYLPPMFLPDRHLASIDSAIVAVIRVVVVGVVTHAPSRIG